MHYDTMRRLKSNDIKYLYPQNHKKILKSVFILFSETWCNVAQASFKHIMQLRLELNPLASTVQVLGLQVCTTKLGSVLSLYVQYSTIHVKLETVNCTSV